MASFVQRSSESRRNRWQSSTLFHEPVSLHPLWLAGTRIVALTFGRRQLTWNTQLGKGTTMSCLTFLLLLIVFGWIALLQLLNSGSKSGELARKFADGLIEKCVGPRKEPLKEGEDRTEKTGD
jgi:hypothetical protein